MTDATVGVCGFGRCGSSMVMAMLDAGGVRPVDGSSERGYELLGGVGALASMPADAIAARAVKLLDSITYYELPKVPWRFIWLDRDHHEQAKSFIKFSVALGIVSGNEPGALAAVEASYVRDRSRVLAAYEALGPVQIMRYEDALKFPHGFACALAEFLDLADFDTDAAGGVVHRRTSECRPGLLFETYGVPA